MAFLCAIRYEVEAVCATPLRTAGAEGDAESVLRDGDGNAFLSGSSLAGALRGWLEPQNRDMALALFGSQSRPGSLIVSDARFDPAAEQCTRPRLRSNGKTGAADEGGKFDLAHIAAGAKFAFTLCWLGTPETLPEASAAEELLGALHTGQILLGAQKSGGFGRVELSVKKRVFSMKNEADRAAWLQDEPGGEPLSLPVPARHSEVVFTLSGEADRILVRAAAEDHSAGESAIGNLTEGGVPILPGSSVKGAVKGRAAAIARACGIPDEDFAALFGRKAAEGDNGRPCRLHFQDVRLAKNEQRITRIRINRFTGGVVRGGLFREEPLCSPVTLRITAPDDPMACALLTFALRDLGLGLYNLGSGGAIGRGYLRVDTVTAEAPGGRRAVLTFQNGGCTVVEGETLLQSWLNAMGGTNREA